MISLFSLSSNDQSYAYLGQIFGVVGTVLQPSGTSGGEATVIGTMFKTLNSTALIVGAILVIYTTVVGLLKTAQEGEFLGKQWSSMWVPFRMVVGIMCLFPTGAGYSVIQIIVMWIVVQGIGAADTLWSTVLNYVNIFGSPYAGYQIPTTAGINQDIQTLYSDLVCANAATGKDNEGNPFPTLPSYNVPNSSDNATANYYYCTDHTSDPFCTQDKLSVILQDPHNSKYSQICTPFVDSKTNTPRIKCNIGPPASGGTGACGSITMSDYQTFSSQSCPDTSTTDPGGTIQCASYYAQFQEVPVIVANLELIAAETNKFDNDYVLFYQNDSNNYALTAATKVPWLQLHCATANLKGTPGSNGCCIYNLQNSLSTFPSFLPPQIVLAIVNMMIQTDGVPHCSIEDPLSTTFPPPYDVNAQGQDYTNMNVTLATNILWPCGLAPIVMNETPTMCITGTSSTSPANFIQTNVNNYVNYINLQVSTAMTAWATAHPQPLTGWEAAAQSAGWIEAGAYYYSMAQTNSKNLKAAIPYISVGGSDPDSANSNTNPMSKYRNNYNSSQEIINLITGGSTQDTSNTPALQKMQGISSSSGEGLATLFMSNMATGSNPLASMQQEGEGLIIGAYTIYAVSITVMTILTVVSAINFIGLGTGIGSNPVAAGVMFAGGWLMGLVFAFCAWSVSIGGILSIYMPLVPYTIFTFAALGWFLGVIEAMVASPFVALGILSPGGQHEIMGRAEPAIMLIFNVFLRPTLMIMGMMMAMLLASVIVGLINSTFTGVMTSVYGTSSLGPIEAMIYITAYSSLVMTALNKVFGLIYMLPEKVLTWIGGQPVSYGEGEMAAQVKGAAEQMASGLGGGMKSGMESGASSTGAAMGKETEHARKGADDKAAAKKRGDVDHDSGVQGPQTRPKDFKESE